MNKSNGLTAEAEIEVIKSDWKRMICNDSNCFAVVNTVLMQWINGAILTKKIIKSNETGNFYAIEYRDLRHNSMHFIIECNYSGPTVHLVYPHQITTIIYKREKPEVSK